jgi:hypothetical protein
MWYAFDSQRKQQKKFEKVLAIACTWRTRKPGITGMPAMEYVEEIVLDEPIQDYRENLLFTVPDNWDPPTCFGNDSKPPALGMTHSSREDDPTKFYTTCYVEEEFSDNIEEKANTTSDEPPKEVT